MQFEFKMEDHQDMKNIMEMVKRWTVEKNGPKIILLGNIYEPFIQPPILPPQQIEATRCDSETFYLPFGIYDTP